MQPTPGAPIYSELALQFIRSYPLPASEWPPLSDWRIALDARIEEERGRAGVSSSTAVPAAPATPESSSS